MTIKEKLIIENKEFVEGWKIKREPGMMRFIITGVIKWALFSSAIVLGDNLIDHKIGINHTDTIVIIIISIMAPVVGWFVNEYRYKNSNKK